MDWQAVAAIVATAVAVIALGLNIESRIAARKAMLTAKRERDLSERLEREMERNPELRIEVINFEPYAGYTANILVRN